MAIGTFKPSAGAKGSKALAVGEGFASGGPAGGLLALIGSNNPNLGAAAKIAGAVGAPGSEAVADMPVDKAGLGKEFDQQASGPALGAEGGAEQSPIGRKLSVLGDENHAGHIDLGIEALDHPDVPHDLRMAAAPVLFAAKHYGVRGLNVPDHIFGTGDSNGDQ